MAAPDAGEEVQDADEAAPDVEALVLDSDAAALVLDSDAAAPVLDLDAAALA